jgi:hypothetical protein
LGVIVKLSLAAKLKLTLMGFREILPIRRLLADGEVDQGMARLVRLYVTLAEARGASHYSESDVSLLTEAAVEAFKDMKARQVSRPMRSISRAVKSWVWAWGVSGAPRPKARLLEVGFPERLLAQ